MNQANRSGDKSSSVSESVSKAGDTVAKAVEGAAKTAQNKASEISDQVSSSVGAISDAASQQMKTFASELERIGKNNPLGMIAGALMVGVVIGLMGRGRT